MKKRLLSALVALVMVLSIIAICPISSKAANLTLADLKAKFPAGKYWNHMPTKGYAPNVNNQDGVTNTPCPAHGNCGTSTQTCNDFALGGSGFSQQCMGFAEKCGYDATGYNPRVNANGWYTNWSSSALDTLKPGDIVRYKNDGHSIYVTGVSGDTVTYGDCNGAGSSYRCIIRWDQTISKATLRATFTNVRSAPSALVGGGGGHTHSYTNGPYYETAHPHKEYKSCSCGLTQYTGNTRTDSSCETCNPISTVTKYNAVLPFKSYLLGTANVSSYTSANLSTTAGTIYPTDECTITAVYSNGACKVTYPISGGTKTAYTQLSNFVANTSTALTSQKVNHQETTYIRASTSSTQYGWIGSGDTIYKMGTSGSMTQVFYPTTSSGWKHAFVATSGLTEPTYDARFNPYCPIRGYIVGTSTIATYEADYTTVAGEIWTTDYCTINAVYANGWVQVSYPAGGGTKTKYAQLSNFIYNPAFVHVKYTANANINVYARPATIGGTIIGWVSPGDVFYVVSTNGSNSQVFYPVDAAYGGGYKFGWCPTSALPQTTYTVSYNANGGSGAPAAQTKTHGVNLTLSSTIPTRTGYTFVGWGTSSSATTAAYAAGAIYTANASITLYAVWTLNKYEISFNANGGFGAPPTQTKTHGVALTLSSTIPQKLYTITYNANGGTVTNASENINCTFSGWGTSSSATTPSYAAGASYTGNENATLYAVWANPTIASYPIPSRNGYVFAGWYTAASGGTELSLTTKITANTTYYAHWDLALYEVFYHANGGQNAPEPQTKTHGVALTLSSEIPTREGFIFLGWSADEFATSPDCMPGSQYAANASIVLFAVWSVVANAETPTITSQPTDKVVDLNAAANLSITAIVSKGTLSYQWYSVASKTNSGGTAIGGATNASYNAPTNVVGTKYYYCVVTNTDNSATGSKTATAVSNAVSVTVNPPVSNALYIVNSATTFAGGTVTIGISLVNNPGIISLRNTVNFDENVLELLSVTDKGLFAGFTPPSATKTSPYTLRWADSFATVNNMANGEFVTVTFKVKSGTPNGSYPVTINHVEARNIDGTELGVANATGYITVNAASSTLRGDVDCNGVVDAADAAAILRFLAGLSELSDRGAINAEVTDVTPGAPNRAAITAEDAAKILRYLANIITVL